MLMFIVAVIGNTWRHCVGRIPFVNVTGSGAYSNHFLESFKYLRKFMWTGIGRSVWRCATGWTVRGSDPSGGEIFPHSYRTSLWPTRTPASTVGNGSVYLGWSDRDGALTTLPPFYPRGQRKSRVIPLPPVWASVACCEMEFTLLMWYFFLTVIINHVTLCHLSWIAWMWPMFFVCCCGQPAQCHAPTLYSSLCTLFSVA